MRTLTGCEAVQTEFYIKTGLVIVDGGRPALAFVAAQGVHPNGTLIVANLLFGGLLFAPPPVR
ncbi:hypothetical protein AB3662_07880 [Sorangium cellulosum]|uniref:hypothetical protein n=1 Tax=Sorangium cellulosum TaxID=56 RepID=UPI003D9A59F1